MPLTVFLESGPISGIACRFGLLFFQRQAGRPMQPCRFPLTFQTMASSTVYIPGLTDAEFGALFFLFNEGLAANPELSRNTAVMGALHALQQSERFSVKLPGEL